MLNLSKPAQRDFLSNITLMLDKAVVDKVDISGVLQRMIALSSQMSPSANMDIFLYATKSRYLYTADCEDFDTIYEDIKMHTHYPHDIVGISQFSSAFFEYDYIGGDKFAENDDHPSIIFVYASREDTAEYDIEQLIPSFAKAKTFVVFMSDVYIKQLKKLSWNTNVCYIDCIAHTDDFYSQILNEKLNVFLRSYYT